MIGTFNLKSQLPYLKFFIFFFVSLLLIIASFNFLGVGVWESEGEGRVEMVNSDGKPKYKLFCKFADPICTTGWLVGVLHMGLWRDCGWGRSELVPSLPLCLWRGENKLPGVLLLTAVWLVNACVQWLD